MGAKFKSRRVEFIAAMRKSTQESVEGAARILQREIILQLNKRGSNKAAGNIPSPPGEPPAKQSGFLGRILVDTSGLTNKNPRAVVGTALKYARIQEFGGVIHIPRIVPKRGKALHWKNKEGKDVFAKSVRAHSVRLPPRPYFRPAIALALPKIEKFVASRFGKVAVNFK